MAVRTRDELMESIKARIGEDTSDEAIAFLEDMTDTLDEYERSRGDGTDWKTRYEENDREWRQRYRDRFYGNTPDPENIDSGVEENTEVEKTRYEDLFVSEEA